MGITEKTAKILPNGMVNVFKKPVMKGKHHLMYGLSPLRNRLYPRKFQVYCLGVPRTGTASIAGLFEKKYRARHEPEDLITAEKIVGYFNNSLDKTEMTSFVKKRDTSLWLEMESSHFLYFYLDILIQEFKEAKFILLMRDCYSWLNSYINHQLGRPLSVKSTFWTKLRDIYFKDNFKHSKQEHILAEKGLYTLDGYLSQWKTYNQNVISWVPEDRLLIVRTSEIDTQTEKLENFVGIPAHSLDLTRSHLNVRTKGFDLLSKIDKNFLKEKFDFYCKDLMRIYFPESYKTDYGIPK
jgi:hypothetical protein